MRLTEFKKRGAIIFKLVFSLQKKLNYTTINFKLDSNLATCRRSVCTVLIRGGGMEMAMRQNIKLLLASAQPLSHISFLFIFKLLFFFLT